jgi:hypothetical protein
MEMETESAMMAEMQDRRNWKEGFLRDGDVTDSPNELREDKATSRLDGDDGFAVATSTSWNFEGLNRETEGTKMEDEQLVNGKEASQNELRHEEELPGFEAKTDSAMATAIPTTTYCSVATQTIDFGAESGNVKMTGPATIEGAEVKANQPTESIQMQALYRLAETSKDLEMDDTMNAEVTESSFFEEPLQIPEIPHLEESIHLPEMSYYTTNEPGEGQPQLYDIPDIAQASQTPLPASPQAEEIMHVQVPPLPQQQEFDAASVAGTHISDDSWMGHVNMAARENLAVSATFIFLLRVTLQKKFQIETIF